MSIRTVAEAFPVAIRDDRLLVCAWVFDRSLLDLRPRVLKSNMFRTKSGTFFHNKTNISILHKTDNLESSLTKKTLIFYWQHPKKNKY